MMDDDDDDGIWNYKSTRKNSRKRRSTDNQPKKTAESLSEEKKSHRKDVTKTRKVKTPSKTKSRHGTKKTSSSTSNVDRTNHVGFCPSCQMPFDLLISGSPQSHVAQCMESDSKDIDECPSGIDCSSRTKLHYQLFRHQLLAENRDICSRGDNPHNHTDQIENKTSLSSSVPDIVVIHVEECPQTTSPSQQPVTKNLKSASISTINSSSKKDKRQNSSQSKSARKDGKPKSASKTITSFFCSQTTPKSPRRRLEYLTQNTESASVQEDDKIPQENVSKNHKEIRILDCLEISDEDDRDISDMLADALGSDSESETTCLSKVGQSDGGNEIIDLVHDNVEETSSTSADFFKGLKDVVVDGVHFSDYKKDKANNEDENCYAIKNITDYEKLLDCVKTDIDTLNPEEQLTEITNSDKNICANNVIIDDVRNHELCYEYDEMNVKVLKCESDAEDQIFNIYPVPATDMNNASGSEEDIFDDKREVIVSREPMHQREITCKPDQKIREKISNTSAEKIPRKITPKKNISMRKQNSNSKKKKSAEIDSKQPSLLSFFQLKCESLNSRKKLNVTDNKLGPSRNIANAGSIKNCSNNILNIKSEVHVEGVKQNEIFGTSSAHINHSNQEPKSKPHENVIKTNSLFDSSKKNNLSVPLATRSGKLKQSDKESTGSITPVQTESESEKSYSSSGYGNRKPNRPCPFYKKMPGTPFTVDAFCYGTVAGCSAYFLTHFHYDHYRGLNKHFQHPIYCTQITANLVKMKLYVRPQFIKTIPLDTPTIIEGVEVTFMEANHCPGSVLILFKLKGGSNLLHTGDFRAHPSMEEYSPLVENKIHTLYLDTTYCDPSYAFAEQTEVIKIAVTLVNDVLHKNPKTLIVCGSYTIGKERVFTAIAQSLGSKVGVTREKKKILDCLEDEYLQRSLTLNLPEAQVHILPMGNLNLKKLHDHLANFPQFTGLLALEPTGWSHSNRLPSLHHIKPKASRNGVTIYGIPYSEHSSFLELKRFVQFLRSDKILPTVNNGNPQSRKKMETIFKDWMTELSSPGKRKSIPRQKTLNTFFQASQ